MHGTGNIDNCGVHYLRHSTLVMVGEILNNLIVHRVRRCRTPAEDCHATDTSSKNVGDLNTDNFEPIAFNHLTGHFTEAFVLHRHEWNRSVRILGWLSGSPTGCHGYDHQRRMSIGDRLHNSERYESGHRSTTSTNDRGGRLAEKDAGGIEANGLDAYGG